MEPAKSPGPSSASELQSSLANFEYELAELRDALARRPGDEGSEAALQDRILGLNLDRAALQRQLLELAVVEEESAPPAEHGGQVPDGSAERGPYQLSAPAAPHQTIASTQGSSRRPWSAPSRRAQAVTREGNQSGVGSADISGELKALKRLSLLAKQPPRTPTADHPSGPKPTPSPWAVAPGRTGLAPHRLPRRVPPPRSMYEARIQSRLRGGPPPGSEPVDHTASAATRNMMSQSMSSSMGSRYDCRREGPSEHQMYQNWSREAGRWSGRAPGQPEDPYAQLYHQRPRSMYEQTVAATLIRKGEGQRTFNNVAMQGAPKAVYQKSRPGSGRPDYLVSDTGGGYYGAEDLGDDEYTLLMGGERLGVGQAGKKPTLPRAAPKKQKARRGSRSGRARSRSGSAASLTSRGSAASRSISRSSSAPSLLAREVSRQPQQRSFNLNTRRTGTPPPDSFYLVHSAKSAQQALSRGAAQARPSRAKSPRPQNRK